MSIPITTTVVGLVTALSTASIAIGGVATAFKVWMPILKGTKENTKQIIEIHTMVNQTATDQRNYNAALIQALVAAGNTVPRDQSLGSPPVI
jgi:hypothetical protein